MMRSRKSRPRIFLSRSARETLAFGRRFAARLLPGDVLRLEGDLGSGKTTFVKGLALGLGLKSADEVRSPTFVIMQVYRASLRLYHFDLYRLEDAGEIEAIGFEEFVNDPHAVTCVEWGQKAGDFFPAAHYRFCFEVLSGNRRRIRVFYPPRVRS